jgi:hypothetical protein
MHERTTSVCRKAGFRIYFQLQFADQLQSQLPEFYSAFVHNFDISNSIRLPSRLSDHGIPALRQAQTLSAILKRHPQ